MMRLTTVGRRSGQPRVAIVGYYEDGPNLVTLAMNGWAEAEPAWWLNLQAQPDTTVELKDGPRAVRGRAADGEERDRLWASFRDYPGWGDDSTRWPRSDRLSGRWSCSSLAPRQRSPGSHDRARARVGLAGFHDETERRETQCGTDHQATSSPSGDRQPVDAIAWRHHGPAPSEGDLHVDALRRDETPDRNGGPAPSGAR